MSSSSEAARRLVEQQQPRAARPARAPAPPASGSPYGRLPGQPVGGVGDAEVVERRQRQRAQPPLGAVGAGEAEQRGRDARRAPGARPRPSRSRPRVSPANSPTPCSVRAIPSRASSCGRTRSSDGLAEPHAAGVGADEAADDVEQRRLARAVGADDADDLAGRDRQRDVVERRQAAEAHRETVHPQHLRRFVARGGALIVAVRQSSAVLVCVGDTIGAGGRRREMSVTLDVELREERRRILAVVDGHLDEVVETAVDAIRADIPVYGDAPAALTADVRGHIRGALPHEGRLPGRRAARHGRGAGVLERHRDAGAPAPASASRTTSTPTASSHRVFWDALLDCAGSGAGGREAALTLATPLMRYCEVASTLRRPRLQRVPAAGGRRRRPRAPRAARAAAGGRAARRTGRCARWRTATASRRTRACSPSSRSPAGARADAAAAGAALARAALGATRTLVVERQGEIARRRRARARLRHRKVCERVVGAARAPATRRACRWRSASARPRTASPSSRARSRRRAPRWSASTATAASPRCR